MPLGGYRGIIYIEYNYNTQITSTIEWWSMEGASWDNCTSYSAKCLLTGKMFRYITSRKKHNNAYIW